MANSHYYDRVIGDFQKDDIVWLHTATDAFMRGLRVGTVSKVGRKWVHVRFGPHKLRCLPNVLAIDTDTHKRYT